MPEVASRKPSGGPVLKSPRQSITALCTALLFMSPFWARASASYAATCSPRQIGPDTTSATGPTSLIFGMAYGETFVATDTLIESITVWRVAADDTSYAGWELFIVGTDSLGQPDVSNVLLHGKVVYDPYGAGYAPMTFSFDPPFALPAPGKYEFAVQLSPCDALGYLLLSLTDTYPDGDLWRHDRSSCDHLRGGAVEGPNADLSFDIVFCDQAVPTKTETWGRMKARYR